jgi:ligand-binding sensor domain-containing protein
MMGVIVNKIFLFVTVFSTSISAQISWEKTSALTSPQQVTTIAITSNNTVFTGTYGGGAYRLVSGENNWTKMTTGLTETEIGSIVVNDSGYIFSATMGGGAFISKNNGDLWTNTTLQAESYKGFVISPKGIMYAGASAAVSRSLDNGKSWTKAGTLPSTGTCPSNATCEILSLAVNSQEAVFACRWEQGVFRSVDSGKTWTAINTGLTTKKIRSIAVKTTGTLFICSDDQANGGVYRSTDNGDSWTKVNDGLKSPYCYSLVFDSKGTMYTATYGGVYHSDNNGDAWVADSIGMSASDRYCMALAIAPDGKLYAGTNSGSIYRGTPSATSISHSGKVIQSGNSFSFTTDKVAYVLAAQSNVTITVNDLSGKSVAVVPARQLPAGSYITKWNSGRLPSGVYICKLKTDKYTLSRAMVINE